MIGEVGGKRVLDVGDEGIVSVEDLLMHTLDAIVVYSESSESLDLIQLSD